MKRRICCFVWLFLLLGTVAAQEKVVKLKIVQTSDIHGNYYPHDFILQQDAAGSLARVYAFVQKERETYDLDCDFLIDLKYAGKDNFTGCIIYPFTDCYVDIHTAGHSDVFY